jgi:hypothetical protein
VEENSDWRAHSKKFDSFMHAKGIEYRNRVASETSNLTSNRSLFILKQVFKHGMEMNAIKNDPVAAMPYLSEKKHVRNEFLMPPNWIICLRRAMSYDRKTCSRP